MKAEALRCEYVVSEDNRRCEFVSNSCQQFKLPFLTDLTVRSVPV